MNSNNFKQYIVVDKGLNLMPGKLASQVSHASIAFLAHMIQNEINTNSNNDSYECCIPIDKDLYNNWLGTNSSFTKIILSAKNHNALNKVIQTAQECGLKENIDFFCIRETNMASEPCLTCIGFKPMPIEIMKPIVGKLQIYK